MGEVITAHLFAGYAPVENNNNARASVLEQVRGDELRGTVAGACTFSHGYRREAGVWTHRMYVGGILDIQSG